MNDYDDFCRSLEWEESLKDYEQEGYEREVLGNTYSHEEYEEYEECEECECRNGNQESIFWLVLIWCILFVLF